MRQMLCIFTTLIKKLNVAVFGFALDVFFLPARLLRALAISGVATGIRLVLNFWCQGLRDGVTTAKIQVCCQSRIPVILLNADLFMKSKPTRLSTTTLLPMLAAPNSPYTATFSCAPRFYILRFFPGDCRRSLQSLS